MRHQWDEGDMYMGLIYSTCAVCGGVRVRERMANVDSINTGTLSIDMVGTTGDDGWQYQDTPRRCPGAPLEFA